MAIDWKTYRQNVTVQAAPSRKKRTQEEKLGELAPFAIGEIYRGEKVTIDDCAKHLGDKTTNSAATLLGRGVGGGGGRRGRLHVVLRGRGGRGLRRRNQRRRVFDAAGGQPGPDAGQARELQEVAAR